MDNNLNVLEAKVLEAVSLIKELRAENQALRERGTELEARLADLEESHSRLNRELEDARRMASEVEDYEEKRKEIEDRVGGLLQKLEALG